MNLPTFATEADLCAAFSAWATGEGWTVYPETGGFDLLLVDADHYQLGIEAKKQLNFKVCSQALPHHYDHTGPDYRGILVGTAPNPAAVALLAHCGLAVFFPQRAYGGRTVQLTFSADANSYYKHHLHDHNPRRRVELPEIIPDVPAGVPAPSTLSPWKIGALRILALLELRGFVTRDDFRRVGIDARRWCASDGWLTSLGSGKWGLGRAPDFRAQHPGPYAECLAWAQQVSGGSDGRDTDA